MDWRVTTLIWFSRLTGLGLVIYYLGPLADLFRYLARMVFDPRVVYAGGAGPRVFNFSEWVQFAFERLPVVLLFCFGLYLALGGQWLLRRMLRGLDGTCPACGQPLPDQGARCTECGFRFRRQA